MEIFTFNQPYKMELEAKLFFSIYNVFTFLRVYIKFCIIFFEKNYGSKKEFINPLRTKLKNKAYRCYNSKTSACNNYLKY